MAWTRSRSTAAVPPIVAFVPFRAALERSMIAWIRGSAPSTAGNASTIAASAFQDRRGEAHTAAEGETGADRAGVDVGRDLWTYAGVRHHDRLPVGLSRD